MKYLLDTHILVWWTLEPHKLSSRQRKVLDALTPEQPAFVSDISLWEIATACSLGRIHLDMPLRDYLTAATALPLIHRVPISPEIAAEVAALPASFHRDPGDRIIVAAARVIAATLLTSDSRIVAARLLKTLK
jgi:PIN domain nuclease of toxin-antitoxin system